MRKPIDFDPQTFPVAPSAMLSKREAQLKLKPAIRSGF
jgi:hypothetical protein